MTSTGSSRSAACCRPPRRRTTPFCAAKTRAPSVKTVRDAVLAPQLHRLWSDNIRVYGARKLRKAARRSGHDVGRDPVARPMRQSDFGGVNRSKKARTTRPNSQAGRHPDLVDSQFNADGPNQLWVTDLTYVRPSCASPTSVSSPTRSHALSSDGGARQTCVPPWTSPRSKRHAGRAARPLQVSCVTRTRSVNSRRLATANASPRTVPPHPSAPSEIPTATPWHRPLAVSTRE